MATKKTYTVQIDSKLDSTLENLKDDLGKTSRAEVFRMGVALLKIAREGKEKGLKLTLSDENDNVQKEIVI